MRTYTVQPVVGAHGKEYQVVNDLGGLVGYYRSKRDAQSVADTRNGAEVERSQSIKDPVQP